MMSDIRPALRCTGLLRATGALAPIAIEEALVEVRAHAIRDELIGGELQAWMKMVTTYSGKSVVSDMIRQV